MQQYVFWLFSLIFLSSGFLIEDIVNPRVIHDLSVGDNIELRLKFMEEELSFLSLDSSVKISCLVVNAESCACFKGGIQEVNLRLTESCASSIKLGMKDLLGRDRGIYLSLLLVKDEQVLHSSPLRIERPPIADTFHNDTSPPSLTMSHTAINSLTLVLPLTLSDFSRAIILLTSLRPVRSNVVKDMIILVPDHELEILSASLSGLSVFLSFPLLVLPESQLLPHQFVAGRYPTYGIQMALKLLVARVVTTPYYLTLDADVVCMHPNLLSSVLMPDGYGGIRGVYHFEEPAVHRFWWESSARVLNLTVENSHVASDVFSRNHAGEGHFDDFGFGVTPTTMSTWGSMLTLQLIQRPHGSNCYADPSCSESGLQNGIAIDGEGHGDFYDEDGLDKWLASLSNDLLWSEYTLYRLALGHYGVFHHLHIRETERWPSENDMLAHVYLHCENVWYAAQLPWKAAQAMANTSCIFSVVQSTTQVSASLVYRQLIQAA